MWSKAPRNIGHYIDRGMPVKKLDNAGREHIFDTPMTYQWYAGIRTCERLGKRLPGRLETMLARLFAFGRKNCGETFNQRQKRVRKMGKELGYSTQDYERAIDLLSNALIRW